MQQLDRAAESQGSFSLEQISFITAQLKFVHDSKPEAEQVLPILNFCIKHSSILSLGKKAKDEDQKL